MDTISILTPDHPHYPRGLRDLPAPPEQLTVSGDLSPARTVAVIGTRSASNGAVRWVTDELVPALVRAGAVIVSGGALGIDAAAHNAAMDAGGRTWLIAPCGANTVYPPAHAALYAEVALRGGAVVWPFPDEQGVRPWTLHKRNEVLAAIASVVVVVQAPAPSGTLNAAAHARRCNRQVWAVPGPLWDRRFTGSRALLDAGARPLTSLAAFFDALSLPYREVPRAERASDALDEEHDDDSDSEDDDVPPSSPSRARAARRARPTAPPRPARVAPSSPAVALRLDSAQLALFEATASEPRHVDEIAARARVCASTAATGLLTLALENVVVEGPEGFYRRGIDT